jgi:uncharacterized membrane protein
MGPLLVHDTFRMVRRFDYRSLGNQVGLALYALMTVVSVNVAVRLCMGLVHDKLQAPTIALVVGLVLMVLPPTVLLNGILRYRNERIEVEGEVVRYFNKLGRLKVETQIGGKFAFAN